MIYSITQVEAIREALAALPEKQSAQRLRKIEVVRALRGEIEALQQRGYELNDIAESLKSSGLEISTATLKNYLQRTRPPAKAAKASAANRKRVAKPAQQSSSGAVEGAAGSDKEAKGGTFTPRSDSDEI